MSEPLPQRSTGAGDGDWLRRCLVGLVLVMTFLFAAVGCDNGDDDEAETATGTATSAATATPGEESPEPTATAASPTLSAGSTGDDELDAVIADVLAGDIDALVARVQYVALACATTTGVGGPPMCATGEVEGTMVEVFPIAVCEGEYYREADVPAAIARELGEDPQLFAAFEVADEGTDAFPRGEIGIVFETSISGTELGVMLGVNGDGEIINIWRGCLASAQDLFDTQRDPAGEVLLPPGS